MKDKIQIVIIHPPGTKYEEISDKLGAALRDGGCMVVTDIIEENHRSAVRISAHKTCDLMIVFDLAGFEAETLTGGCCYNLLDCKQIHLLYGNRQKNERILAKPLSISMFFYCEDQMYYEYLRAKYTGIPYLKLLESKEAGTDPSRHIMEVVKEVREICRL